MDQCLPKIQKDYNRIQDNNRHRCNQNQIVHPKIHLSKQAF